SFHVLLVPNAFVVCATLPLLLKEIFDNLVYLVVFLYILLWYLNQNRKPRGHQLHLIYSNYMQIEGSYLKVGHVFHERTKHIDVFVCYKNWHKRQPN
ncbi:hypothetical protein ACJX0J_012918, partial [Zea mays]